jgi:hypothetical protein
MPPQPTSETLSALNGAELLVSSVNLLLGGRDALLAEVIRRAVARGEVTPGQISERVARLPIDLFRHELMMTLRPVPDQSIVEIVDDVFMPLVRLGATTT